MSAGEDGVKTSDHPVEIETAEPYNDDRIEVVEETARIDVVERVTGTDRIRLLTDTVEETLRDALARRTVSIERVPVDRMIEAVPEPRVENGVTILSIVEERLVVEKRLFLVEEVRIRHETTSENIEIPVTLRKQRVLIERSSDAAKPSPQTRNELMSLNTPAASNRQMVTAFFDDRDDAENAVERIVDAGVARSEVKLVEGADPSAAGASATTAVEPERERGFFEALGDFFMPDEDKHVYAEGLTRGGYLVSVPTTDHNRDAILDILDDEGTVDMDERESTWRSEGWSGQATGYDAAGVGTASTVGYGAGDSLVSRDDVETRPVGSTTSGPGTAATVGGADVLSSRETTGATRVAGSSTSASGVTGSDDALADHDGTIEVVEERMRVGKRDVAGGRVRVRSYVVEDAVSQDVSLHSERVDIERRTVDRPVASFDAAFKDQTIEFDETSQEAVVSKDARVTEEIDLNRIGSERTETVSDTVRRTEVDIDDERRGASLGETEVRDEPVRKTGTLGLPGGRADKKL